MEVEGEPTPVDRGSANPVICDDRPEAFWITGEVVGAFPEVIPEDGFVVTRNEIRVHGGTFQGEWISVFSPGGVGPDGVSWRTSHGIQPEPGDTVAAWVSPRPLGGYIASDEHQWFRDHAGSAVTGSRQRPVARGTWHQVLTAFAACGGVP